VTEFFFGGAKFRQNEKNKDRKRIFYFNIYSLFSGNFVYKNKIKKEKVGEGGWGFLQGFFYHVEWRYDGNFQIIKKLFMAPACVVAQSSH